MSRCRSKPLNGRWARIRTEPPRTRAAPTEPPPIRATRTEPRLARGLPTPPQARPTPPRALPTRIRAPAPARPAPRRARRVRVGTARARPVTKPAPARLAPGRPPRTRPDRRPGRPPAELGMRPARTGATPNHAVVRMTNTSSHFGFLGCGGVGWLGWGRLRRCSAGRARWRPSEGQGFQELGPGGEHNIGAQGLQVVEEAGPGSKRLAGVPPSA